MAKKEQEEELPKTKSRNQMRPKSHVEENEPREEAPEKKQRNKSPESVADSGDSPNTIKNFFVRLRTDDRLHRILGAFLLFIVTPYLLTAFTSYFFTWQHDQDKVAGSLGVLFDSKVEVYNMLGKLGALFSHIFIHSWFGVTSYFFPIAAFAIGLRLLTGSQWLPVGKILKFGTFALVFGSIILGYIFQNSFFFLGGTFGYETSAWLNSALGAVGTGLLILFSAVVFLIVVFNLKFNLPESAAKEEPLQDAKAYEQHDEIKRNVLVNDFPNNQPEELTEIEEYVSEEEQDVLEEPEIVEESEIVDIPQQPEPVVEFNEIELSPQPETLTPAMQDLTSDDNINFTVEKKEEDKELSVDEIEAKSEELVREFGEYDPTLDLSGYQFPSIDLLENYGTGKEPQVNTEELTLNKNRIVETLANYGIAIEKIKATIGPTVTLYEINPAAGVRISKIKNLEDDIALSLSALGIRIIAPIPGKGTIGIEVPNQHPDVVPMRALLSSEKFVNSNMDLPVALGKTISNEIFIADLAKMPHLLMAGATGQGKSVGLNAILVSLLYKKHPAQLKFVLVDPKKVELTLFNKIERHFLAKLPDSEEAIITDTKKVIHTLNSLCIEMDQRYDLLKDAQVRNLKEYNAKFIQRKLNPENGHRFLPYIVLVVDEFADLIMTAGKEVETPIARLAQLARAIGIHLIIATQRPSVNIITGTIKANFPARIAFRVTSKIDSRTILDAGGAEQLIGRGDLLYSTGNDLIRLQCAFVDTPEVEKITDFIGGQRAYPSALLLPEYVDENAESGKMELDDSDRDSLFEEAARIVVNHQQGSASLLQRKLKLGYNRAGRIVDQLEAAGIIGPFEGSKAREVLIKDILTLEEKLGKKNDSI
jgi:S-DNA-T family DNA segregation ATPase FtsK/SpoIIIE